MLDPSEDQALFSTLGDPSESPASHSFLVCGTKTLRGNLSSFTSCKIPVPHRVGRVRAGLCLAWLVREDHLVVLCVSVCLGRGTEPAGLLR